MSATRTYSNVTPAQAEKFIAAARTAGFVTSPLLVDLSYDQPFRITKQIALSTLGFSVYYNGTNQTCVISLTDLPFFLTADVVMSKLDGYVAAAQSEAAMPNMSIWSNPVAHTNHKVRQRAPWFAAFDLKDEPDHSRRPRDFAKLYKFPLQFTGKGTTAAIIELGGGLDDADMVAFGYKGKVGRQLIDGATETLDGVDGAQGEVTLDAQVIADIAPDANIQLYFSPNTDDGFANAINQATKDILASKKSGVISISWGGPFDQFSEAGQMNLATAIQFAKDNGILVFAASGDNLADDGSDHAIPDCPACLPDCIGVGGTFLTTKIDANGAEVIASETVWNRDGSGSGGGICAYYPANAWQTGLNYTEVGNNLPLPLEHRGSPDVCAVADPESGDRIVVAGQNVVVGGTSAAAPRWAALICLLLEANGGKPLPNFLENIYSLAQGAETRAAILNDILPPGSNGVYEVVSGWDPATGCGSPRGDGLLPTFTDGKES